MNTTKNNASLSRLDYLDGLRGIAALLVVFCHLSCVFIPELYFYKAPLSSFQKIYFGTPLNVLTNGNASVCLFFVLSGFLLSRKVYFKERAGLTTVHKTYVKLLKLVIPAVAFSLLLMVSGLMKHNEAYLLNAKLSFVSDYNMFSPNIFGAVKDVFFDTFVSGSIFVGPLWTIHYELVGSLLVMLISYYIYTINKNAKINYFLLILIFNFCVDSYYASFLMGALTFECLNTDRNSKNSLFTKIQKIILKYKVLYIFLFCIGIYFACVGLKFSGIYRPLKHIPFINDVMYRSIGISICIFCISISKRAQTPLQTRIPQFLGKISPYLYIFHWSVILSAGCGLFIVMKDLPYRISIIIIAFSVIIISILVSWLYMKIQPVISRLISNCYKRILSKIKKRCE